jgi:hypothetical protein
VKHLANREYHLSVKPPAFIPSDELVARRAAGEGLRALVGPGASLATLSRAFRRPDVTARVQAAKGETALERPTKPRPRRSRQLERERRESARDRPEHGPAPVAEPDPPPVTVTRTDTARGTSFEITGPGDGMRVGWKRDRTEPPARVTLRKTYRSGERRVLNVLQGSPDEEFWRSVGFA